MPTMLAMAGRWLILLIALGCCWPRAAWANPEVLHLTLDDRPCNTLLVQQLAAIAGINLTLTVDPARAAEADLVSLNAATFGSLVASRSGDPTTLPPLALKPGALAHFAVPRAQPFVKDDTSLAAYAKALESLKSVAVQETVRAAIAGEGPAPLDPALADYARRLRGWIAWLEASEFEPDRLLITLDDNRPGPLAAWLKNHLQGVSHHVQDGTDEGMMLLLARWCREHQSTPRPPELGIAWTDPAGLLTLHAFESGMPVENVLRMADWLKLRVTPNLSVVESWRPVLWLHGTPETSAATIIATGDSLAGRRVVLADFATLNKGDVGLFNAWAESQVPPGLIGYLGWNTASNTLGSAVALWAALDYGYAERSDPESVRAGAELFLWARLLDDWLYAGEVRPAFQETLKARSTPTSNLAPDEAARVAEELQFLLLETWQRRGQSLEFPFTDLDPRHSTTALIGLPWGRLFEIGVVPLDPRGFLPTVKPAVLPVTPR